MVKYKSRQLGRNLFINVHGIYSAEVGSLPAEAKSKHPSVLIITFQDSDLDSVNRAAFQLGSENQEWQTDIQHLILK